MHYRLAYEQWLADPAIDSETKSELRALAQDDKEIEDRFYRELEFGTAGMRGVIGAGTNRMNIYTVAKATQGFANHLRGVSGAAERGIAIAYDSRRKSDAFAREAALVLCANGIRVFLFDDMRSVPQLSFTLRYLKCIGGIVITASHNPKQYNGYKVYWEQGAQIGPELANELTRAISAVESFADIKRMSEDDAKAAGLLVTIGEKEDDAYFAATESLSIDRELVAHSDCKMVYTPLHGTGYKPVRRILGDIGIRHLYIVEEQAQPDPDFSTVSAPNPEAPDAFDLAKKLGDKVGANLLIATDPDSDRLGVAVRQKDGTFCTLSGNQIGCLLMHYILLRKKEKGRLSPNTLVVKSIVSTNMANAIAKRFGVEIAEVLTGFRFVGEKIVECEKSGKQFEFGFEESFGFLAGTFVRDKDAICAAMLVAELAAYYNKRGMTLIDAIFELYELYGCYREHVKSYTLYGKEGMEKIQQAMKSLREAVPAKIGEYAVKAVRDYKSRRYTVLATHDQLPIGLPSSDVLYFEMADGSWVCVRPSGTEPKLKVYANGAEKTEKAADAKLNTLIEGIETILSPYLL